jgi:hypothetical protein
MGFSRHATVRARQRGVLPAQVSALLAHGDMEVRRGSGCYAIWISKRVLRQLGPITPEGVPIDRLALPRCRRAAKAKRRVRFSSSFSFQAAAFLRAGAYPTGAQTLAAPQ